MPGPVSDSYDPQWGTAATSAAIREALDRLYSEVSLILNDEPPVNILSLMNKEAQLNTPLPAVVLTEWQWRMIRFAIERANESI